MDYRNKLALNVQAGLINPHFEEIITSFFESYEKIIKLKGQNIQNYAEMLSAYLNLILEQIQKPYNFLPYHQGITSPFDYYKFSNDLLSPLINISDSKLLNPAELDNIEKQLHAKENVFLLSNHQSEAEPQAISALFGECHQHLAQDMVYIAGHRVTSDPLAVPLSKGRNLLCIYSKRHINNPPELKAEKLRHNHKAMQALQELLSTGGKLIYIAPSGGRDRLGEDGNIEVAPFDPASLEMMMLLARKSKTKTHFYPMALATYNFLPPPKTIDNPIGEVRNFQYSKVGIAIGEELNFENTSYQMDKVAQRQLRAVYAWEKMLSLYKQL